MDTTLITDIELLELLGKTHCRYCAREIWLDYSDMDYADPTARPIPRDVTNDEYHNCTSKRIVRLYERGVLD